MDKKLYHLMIMLFLLLNLISCASQFASKVIAKPDEYTRVYEAKEKYILRAIATVLKEKEVGRNITIDYSNNRVDSDYVESGDWRTKTSARVKRINWRECEVTLAVTTEKKTDKGWEMRRLLEKEQYDTFFSVIELKIFDEMAKMQ